MTSLQGTDSLGSIVSLVLRGDVQHCHFSILLAKLDMYDSEVPLYSNFPLSQVPDEADQDHPPQGGTGGGRVHEVGEGL